MERSPIPEFGGVIRVEQNWIGGSSYNPGSATFVPPPAEHIQMPAQRPEPIAHSPPLQDEMSYA